MLILTRRITEKMLIGIFGLLLLSLPLSALADETTVGRYLTVNDKPKEAQLDLLAQTIQVRFPASVQTVGDAMNYLLKLSGYSLVPADKQNTALKVTLTKPLPAIDRDFGPMPLKEGLTTLAGSAFYLVQDPINRMVDFKLKPPYASLYEPHVNNSKRKA